MDSNDPAELAGTPSSPNSSATPPGALPRATPSKPSDAAQKLRTDLIRAGREMLDESDSPLELRKVAERIGKSRTAPYLVFGKTEEGGGLEALLIAVAAGGMEDLLLELRHGRASASDPEDSLTEVALAYLRFARAHPRLFRLMFGPEAARAIADSGNGPSQRPEVPHLVNARIQADDLIRELVESCQHVGAIGAGESRTYTMGVWAALHGAAMLLLDGQLTLAGHEPGLEEAAALTSGLLIHSPAFPIAAAVNAFGEALAVKGRGSLASESAGTTRIRSALSSSSALRRVQRARQVFEGSRILWIADRPEQSAAEQRALESLGVEVARAPDTLKALQQLHRMQMTGFDLILSDIARHDSRTAGMDELPLLKRAAPTTPVIFYVDEVDPRASRPTGSFGITDDPGELLHLILDVLERKRL